MAKDAQLDKKTAVPILDFSRQYAALRPQLLEAVTKAMGAKELARVVFVPGKILNLVTRDASALGGAGVGPAE